MYKPSRRGNFIVKKKALLLSTRKHGSIAGQGHAYLRETTWWVGL